MKEKIKNFFINLYEKIRKYILEKLLKVKEVLKSTSDDLTTIDIEEGMARFSMQWWFMKSLKWLIAAILALLTLFLWGCGGTTVTKYYPVSVPVACSAAIPEKPVYSKDLVITNMDILAYAEKLHSALQVCVKEGIND